MAISKNTRRSGVRISVVVVIGVLSLVGLSGCSLPSGAANRTLRDGAVQTQQEVTSLLANLPLAWLKSDATDVPTNDYSYCESVIDTGPSGSAAWTYGLGFDLVEPMSNAELLKLLTPSGDQWVLRPEQSIAGSTKKPSIEKSRTMYLIYDAPDMTIVVFLNAESSTRPRVAVSASTSCIRNGDTGPGTFPAPTPTSVPVPSAAP